MRAACVSVFCTVRDEARHVHAALSSALANDVAEVVVVDDGSTDATPSVLRELADADARVRVTSSPPDGRGRAIDRAVRLVRGDYVLNLDGDDVIHPEWVRIARSILHADRTMAVVAASPRYVSQDEVVGWPALERRPIVRDVTSRLAYYNPIVHSSAMMRRTAVDAVGGYDGQRRTHVDYDLWIRLARAGWKIGVVDAPLVAKRLHAGQKFEVGNRLSYLYNSAITQAQAIRAVGGGSSAWAVLGGRLAWGVLPRVVRMSMRRLLAERSRRSMRAPRAGGGGLEGTHATVDDLRFRHRRQPAANEQ